MTTKTIRINGDCDLPTGEYDIIDTVGGEGVWVIRKSDHRAVKMVLDPAATPLSDAEALRTLTAALDSQPDSVWVRPGMLKGQWLLASDTGWSPIVDIRSGARQPAWNTTPARLVPVRGLNCITRDELAALVGA